MQNLINETCNGCGASVNAKEDKCAWCGRNHNSKIILENNYVPKTQIGMTMSGSYVDTIAKFANGGHLSGMLLTGMVAPKYSPPFVSLPQVKEYGKERY